MDMDKVSLRDFVIILMLEVLLKDQVYSASLYYLRCCDIVIFSRRKSYSHIEDSVSNVS